MAFSLVIRLNKRPNTVCAIRKKGGAILKALKFLWYKVLLGALAGVSIIAASAPSLSQAIVLNPADIVPELTADAPDTRVFYINGALTHGLTGAEDDQRRYSSPAATKLLLSLLTLRMADSGVLDLDAPVSQILPELVPANPFAATITVRHLLQETAGFASPPLSITSQQIEAPLSNEKLAPFAINIRGAGQASNHDPVGWAILVTLVEQVGGAPTAQLIEHQITQPLGLQGGSLNVRYHSLGGVAMPLAAKMSLASFAEIIRPLIRNRDVGNQPFLNRDTHAAFVGGSGGFRLHPNGNSASSGISVENKTGFGMVTGLNAACDTQLAFAAFPAQGVAFIAADGVNGKTGDCAPSVVYTIALKQAKKHFPQTNTTATPKPELARPSKLEGRYIPADRSPAGLSERLTIMQLDWLTLYGDGKGGLVVKQRDGSPMVYREISPYEYATTAENMLGSELLFSPYRLGGYLAVSDGFGAEKLYRRVDSLGRTAPLFALMPFALLLIASAGIYAFRPPTSLWRKMALFGLVGSALVGTGLYFEINSWAAVLYEQNQPWLIVSWRTVLNGGLMLMLALPMFVFSFSRGKTIPRGAMRLILVPHLALITAAALTVFITLVMAGVAGTFAPY